jgi:D-alanine-D-alanine ligase
MLAGTGRIGRTMAKLRVGLVFGGRSVEHEVSIASATSILRALDPSRYEVWLIGVGTDGRWHLGEPGTAPEATLARGPEVFLPAAPGGRGLVGATAGSTPAPLELDVVFPIVHGSGGEDGTLQGLLEMAGVAYVGAGVLGSALQMDKEVAKRLLAAASLPVVPWTLVRKDELRRDARQTVARALRELDLPLFVKPANGGSSVGTRKVVQEGSLGRALAEASRYDEKVLVERAIDAREIEVAVLGHGNAEASIPGEIRPRREFYDYEAKYVDEATELLVPAPLDDGKVEETRQLALRAYRVLEGTGLGRVDFLLERDTQALYVNEVNSLPGFTEVSMYPRLWEASGLPYPQLLDRLIELALERRRERAGLETIYRSR